MLNFNFLVRPFTLLTWLLVLPNAIAQVGGVIVPEDDVQEIPEDDGMRDDRELSLSDAELRSRHFAAAGMFLGETLPWATAGVEFRSLQDSYRSWSILAGVGAFEEFGKRTDARAIDYKADTKTVGATYRWYFKKAPLLCIQSSASYSAWKGKASPHGVDAENSDAAADSLSSGFDATSIALGLGFGFSRVWENGVYFDWLPVAIKKSKVLRKNLSRDQDETSAGLTRFIERQEIFGFINASVGIYF